MIVKAVSSEAPILTQIALTSKQYWNYSNEQIQAWKDDLTVTATMIETQHVFNYVVNNEIVGFYILNQPQGQEITLEFLFVLPKFIGKGIGRELLQHSEGKAKQLHCNTINLLADSNAEAFYKSQGFKTIDKKESSIKNRFLPIMQKRL